MSQSLIPDDLTKLVKAVFKKKKKVCGHDAWASFAAAVHRLTQENADGARAFLTLARQEANAILVPAEQPAEQPAMA